jgi:hypothetical protein
LPLAWSGGVPELSFAPGEDSEDELEWVVAESMENLYKGFEVGGLEFDGHADPTEP